MPSILYMDFISIHSLHTEGDHKAFRHKRHFVISIHSLHTEGDKIRISWNNSWLISIHSLHTEGDRFSAFLSAAEKSFQSTPSTRRETICGYNENQFTGISIHSLHTEGDRWICRSVSALFHFNPLPPHGGRPVLGKFALSDRHFNPLPPHGGRPQNCTGKRFSFRLSLYNPAKKDAKDYILHPKK